MDKISKQLYKKVKKMDLGNPVITTLVGLVVFYIEFEPTHVRCVALFEYCNFLQFLVHEGIHVQSVHALKKNPMKFSNPRSIFLQIR